MEKKCTKCGVIKPVDSFYKNNRRKDGLMVWCKNCSRDYSKKWKESNKEHVSQYNMEYMKVYSAQNREQILEQRAKYREINRENLREKAREYYYNNQELCILRSNIWREENKELIKERRKAHRLSNPEYYKQKGRERRERTKEYMKEYRRQYYLTHKEEYRQKGRERRENNKEYIREYRREYYRSHPNAPRMYINRWTEEVHRKYRYTCQCCRSGKNIVAHHIYSKHDNPELRIQVANGITLCSDCHIEFHQTYGYGNNDLAQLTEFMEDKGKGIKIKEMQLAIF